MADRVTIKDIAKLAKVSTTAVSMALNNRPGVSAKTRERILALAKQLDYQPNYIAKSLISRHSYTIGLILNSISDLFFPELAQAVEEEARRRGYNLLLCNTNRDLQAEKDAIDMLRSKGVDGILLTTVLRDDPHIPPLVRDQFPFVLLLRVSMDPDLKNQVDFVVLDNFRGGYAGMEHLYRLGHDRIALITGNRNTSTATLRTQGALQALSDHGVKQDPALVVEGGYRKRRAYEAAQKLMAMDQPPTAYFAQDDYMALGVRQALLERGVRIPEDVALMGFDDMEMASIAGIDLTTISQEKHEMGTVGARILIDKVERKVPKGMVNQIILEARLAIRKSCGYHMTGYVRG